MKDLNKEVHKQGEALEKVEHYADTVGMGISDANKEVSEAL